jgi:hypothetical protein
LLIIVLDLSGICFLEFGIYAHICIIHSMVKQAPEEKPKKNSV